MERILVVGCSGGGKTTFAAALARELGLVHVELDSIYHQPGWTALPEGEFRDRVADLTAQGGWVVDGNYAITYKTSSGAARTRSSGSISLGPS